MNDRFKFRGFHPVLAEVQEIKFIDFIHNTVDFGDGDIFDIEEVELHQCTGLKDKNGKLIYEGDILGGSYGNLYVHYCDNCKQFQLKANDYGCMACEGDIHWYELVESENELEVIGNIYENKELIDE